MGNYFRMLLLYGLHCNSAILHRCKVRNYINECVELLSHKTLFTKQIVGQS